MARDLQREAIATRAAGGDLTYVREWTESEDGQVLVERFTNGRLDGQPISDRELRLLLAR